MDNRVIDISENGAALTVHLDQLVLWNPKTGRTTMPLEDIAVLVVSHPAVTYTQAVLSRLAEKGGSFILCDSKRLPIGALFPLRANSVQTERIGRQAAASLPIKKRIWKDLVRAKITAQAACLRHHDADASPLLALIDRVRSGDPENVEARAARIYWPALLGPAFRRSREAPGINAALNYGYAVTRAIVARAVAAAGLHPSLGVHHKNRYDPFALADDLMEPFRPIVDDVAAKMELSERDATTLSKGTRAAIIGAILERRESKTGMRSIFDIASRMASSMADIFCGAKEAIWMPTWEDFFKSGNPISA